VKPATKEIYRAKEFASLAGVTVRALHHYDRFGLLRPKQRSQAGYRLYSLRDFAPLGQLVVLKFLGIPLKQISRLLQPEANLADVLQKQREVLLTKRLQPDWKLFQLIIQELQMQKNIEWKGKYFSTEARAKVMARRNQLPRTRWSRRIKAGPTCTRMSKRRSERILLVRRSRDRGSLGETHRRLHRWRSRYSSGLGSNDRRPGQLACRRSICLARDARNGNLSPQSRRSRQIQTRSLEAAPPANQKSVFPNGVCEVRNPSAVRSRGNPRFARND
jgi:DNA-binding transcriptional MerR regulator